MSPIDKDRVLLLHQLLTQETGGSHGVRDVGLLDSALQSAFATFDGKELYPTKEEKGARLGLSLISNHAFVDGNKRIGMYIMLSFLRLSGIHISCTDDDIVKIAFGVADGSVTYEGLLEWV